MSIPGSATPLLLATTAAGPAAAFQVDRSLRFDSSASSYLSRTPSSAGNRKTWTWSGWVKRSGLGAFQKIFGNEDSSEANGFAIQFRSDDSLQIYDYTSSLQFQKITTQVFRDPSAWYHIVVAVDTTDGTAGDRAKIYVNSSRVTSFSSDTNPSQNADTQLNDTTAHGVGRSGAFNSSYLDGYLTDVHFIDGQALAPTDFGETDSNSNWNPKAYAGTYGTNGFHLDFSDNSSNAALGYDAAGSNDWTVNNLVATAPGLETANQGFDVVTYTGNGTTQTISGLAFQPDLVWIKNRGATGNHTLWDVVRGANKRLMSDSTAAEATRTGGLTEFTSDGFTHGNDGTGNTNNDTYVAWCWKAGGTASSNTDGTITSSVSVNTTYGFSICTYTGDGSGTANSDSGDSFGHGLSSAPKFILCKRRNSANGWPVYHASTALGALSLNGTNTLDTGSYLFAQQHPSSSVVYLGNNPEINATGSTYVAYCWSEVSGFSKFGSYSGGTNPQTITTGFKPRFLIIKRTDTTNHWMLIDSKRGGTKKLAANESVPENNLATIGDDAQNVVEFLVDGFKLTTTNAGTNVSGGTYVYAAFAEKPDESVIDSLIDTPTNADTPTDTGAGGEVVGNYATLNPLHTTGINGGTGAAVLSNGNLEATSNTSAYKNNFGTIVFPAAGKYYFEVTVLSNNGGSNNQTAGIAAIEGTVKKYLLDCFATSSTSKRSLVDSSATSLSGSFNVGDVIGVAVDCDAGTAVIKHNNTDIDSGYTLASGVTYAPFFSGYNCGTSAFNFGQRAWVYSAPSNHKALCTTNLPDPTIADGSTAFDAKVWSGNSTARDITGYGFSPDLVWGKSRSHANSHWLMDIVRGAGNRLISNDTRAEDTPTGVLTSFNSDGFSLGTNDEANESGRTYVGWAWDGGSSTVSNTDGSITSSVRANASAGFSIATYTSPNSSSDQSFGHGLNAKPDFVIVKNRDSAYSWDIYHSSLGYNSSLIFTTAATRSGAFSAEPTSSVVNTKHDYTHVGTDDYVAYCWTAVEGYSAFGSYTGNGASGYPNADGPFVYVGFRPRFVLIKASSQAENWVIYDTARSTYNVLDDQLYPNASTAETSGANREIDVYSNGFKIRSNSGQVNSNNATYVYAAFGDPFKTARAR